MLFRSKASSTSPDVTTTIVYDGLTTTTKRFADVEKDGVTTRVALLVEEVTKNLAGEIVERKSPDQNGDGQAEVTTYITQYPAQGGAIHTTTYPDLSVKVVTTYRDGQIKSIAGTAVPDESYDYGTHNEQGGGLWTKVTQSNGTEWVKTYRDAIDRRIRKEYPDGAAETMTYHLTGAGVGAIGKLASVEDPDQIAVSYGYNAEGELAVITEPMPGNQQRVTTVDSDIFNDETLGITHRERKWINGVLVSSEFSASDGYSSRADRLEGGSSWFRTSPSDGAWTTTGTTEDGQKVVKTFHEGKLVRSEFFDNQSQSIGWTEWTYDGFGRIATEADSQQGSIILNGYTESGRLLSMTDSGNRATAWAYDVMGRAITVDLPDSPDASGNQLANITHTSYYNTGKIQAVWGDQTNPTYRTYDEQNRLTGLRTYRSLSHGIQPEAGTEGCDITSWIYDAQRGWLTSKLDATLSGADYTYYPSGRLWTRRWARTLPGTSLRLSTTYGYNAGKLTSTTYNDGVTQAVGYTYDIFGRPKQITQGGNTWGYDYDPSTLQLAHETVTYDTDFDGTGDFTRILSRSRDAVLRPTGYQLGNGTTVEAEASYTYDDAGRLHTVGDDTDIFTYSYELGSHLPKTVVGPVHTVTNTWDTTRDALLTKENRIGMSVVSAYEYDVNTIGQRQSVVRTSDVGNAFTIDWGYNARGEMTSSDNTVDARDRFFEFDPIGNRVQSRTGTHTGSGGALTTYVANALNQYTAINSTAPVHDADGNQLFGPLPTDSIGIMEATWDGENRMTEAKHNSTTVGNYRYDPFGRRIYKNGSATGSRWFIYDGWNLVSEHQVSEEESTVLRTHLWGSDLSGSMQGAGGVGGLLSTEANELGLGGKYYPTYDGNGNIIEYLDGVGNVHAYFEYDSFGSVVESSGMNTGFFFRFSTKFDDFETGLNYYGYRYYDPRNGRWISRDPLGEKGGSNIFAISTNDVQNYYDYLGFILRKGSAKMEALVDKLGKLDPALKKMIDDLEGSSKDHNVLEPFGDNKAKDANCQSHGGTSKEREKESNGEGIGTDTRVDPDNVVPNKYDKNIVQTPLDILAHELQHAHDIDRGVINRDDSSGVSVSEQRAVRTQNIARKALGLPLRNQYAGVEIPDFGPENSPMKNGESEKTKNDGKKCPCELKP